MPHEKVSVSQVLGASQLLDEFDWAGFGHRRSARPSEYSGRLSDSSISGNRVRSSRMTDFGGTHGFVCEYLEISELVAFKSFLQLSRPCDPLLRRMLYARRDNYPVH